MSNWLHSLVDTLLHIDRHLVDLVAQYGQWVYGILFAVIFAETGLVATPFLPGDSLIFAAGAISVSSGLDPWLLGVVLIAAAVLGDTTNYWIGRGLGPRVFARERSRWFNPAHLVRTQAFYDKHGGRTLVMARFIPIVRTFAPFVAGIGKMPYPRFLSYSVAGGVLWVTLFVTAGHLFGNLPMVRDNFTLVIFGIIGVSLIPPIVEVIRAKRR